MSRFETNAESRARRGDISRLGFPRSEEKNDLEWAILRARDIWADYVGARELINPELDWSPNYSENAITMKGEPTHSGALLPAYMWLILSSKNLTLLVEVRFPDFAQNQYKDLAQVFADEFHLPIEVYMRNRNVIARGLTFIGIRRRDPKGTKLYRLEPNPHYIRGPSS